MASMASTLSTPSFESRGPEIFWARGSLPRATGGSCSRWPPTSLGLSTMKRAPWKRAFSVRCDRVLVALDVVVGGVVRLADPLRGDGVEPEQDLRLALELGDGPAVPPDVRGDLAARERRQLGVEPAEAHDRDVLLRVPALLLGQHRREDPGGRADAGHPDRLALEVGELGDRLGDVEREVVPVHLRGDEPDRHPGGPEHRHVGRPGGPDVELAGDDGLDEVGAPAERLELDGHALGPEEALLLATTIGATSEKSPRTAVPILTVGP